MRNWKTPPDRHLNCAFQMTHRDVIWRTHGPKYRHWNDHSNCAIQIIIQIAHFALMWKQAIYVFSKALGNKANVFHKSRGIYARSQKKKFFSHCRPLLEVASHSSTNPSLECEFFKLRPKLPMFLAIFANVNASSLLRGENKCLCSLDSLDSPYSMHYCRSSVKSPTCTTCTCTFTFLNVLMASKLQFFIIFYWSFYQFKW